MSDISKQAKILSDLTADYRRPPSPEHIVNWISQFDDHVRLSILRELTHVLNKTYFSLARVKKFLTVLSRSKKLGGNDLDKFWRNINFLNQQGGGGSQKEMLALFSQVLNSEFGFNISETGKSSSTFAYVDDAMFTGGRVRTDLTKWIVNDAPNTAIVHVVVIALHSGAHYFVSKQVEKEISKSGKDIQVHWWRLEAFEDRKYYTSNSDVLRPVSCPDDILVDEYVKGLKYPVDWRKAGSVGKLNLFSSDEGRQVLEQEFLKAGAKIRKMCPHLGVYQRPLGNMVLETLGFGSLIVTFRNCPNNAPLALWAGDPWIPLFPRTTNSDTEVLKFVEMMKTL